MEKEKEILTIDEVVELTGLTKGTIYILNYKNEIPCFKFGPRLLRFKRSEILKWMENRDYRPISQVMNERNV